MCLILAIHFNEVGTKITKGVTNLAGSSLEKFKFDSLKYFQVQIKLKFYRFRTRDKCQISSKCKQVKIG